jgi:ubiquinone/menaquinone biosynthesis C-methylase UbiE
MESPSSMYFEDGEAYDQRTQGPCYDLWFEMIEHYIDSFLPEEGLLLDAGGGTGEFTIRAAKLRKKLICENLDISKPMLAQADRKIRENGMKDRIKTKHCDIQDMQYPSDHFDYVMCLGDAISFCPDHELAFRELVRVTKPHGHIHLSVNSFWGNCHAMYTEKSRELGVSFDDALKYMESRILHMNGQSTGCRSFTMKELSKWAEQHNLSIAKRFAAPVFPSTPEWYEDPVIYKKIRDLQYRYCEEENIMEFGNHLNVIYRKER